MLMTFVDGIVWGWVYYKTGRLLPCAILHSVGNLLCAVLPTFLMAVPFGMPIYIVIYYLAAPVTAAIIFAKFVKKQKMIA